MAPAPQHERREFPTKRARRRCPWGDANPLQRAYHDTEWGVPVHHDGTLFEFLILEGAQAGLSWETILRKREAYRQAYDGFHPSTVARYDAAKRARLLRDRRLVRNRLKIAASVRNARAFVAVQKEFGSFDHYLWRFVGETPRVNAWRRMGEVPARTPQSDVLSRDLKKRGFKFVGTTICYAYMQAVGLVNDHLVSCFRHRELRGGQASPGVWIGAGDGLHGRRNRGRFARQTEGR